MRAKGRPRWTRRGWPRKCGGGCRPGASPTWRASCRPRRSWPGAAAWLHDVAKELPQDTLLKLAERFGIIFDDEMAHMPHLWHAPVAAELARREFGVSDPDVLAAVRHHPTGRAGMSPLERIVFLADLIEPGRSFPGVDELRRLSTEDLDAALLAAYDGLIRYVLDKGGLLHSDTVAARNEILLRRS